MFLQHLRELIIHEIPLYLISMPTLKRKTTIQAITIPAMPPPERPVYSSSSVEKRNLAEIFKVAFKATA